MLRLYSILFLICSLCYSTKGQNAFTCEGQVWIVQNDNSLAIASIGTNGGINLETITEDLGVQIMALGFSKVDRMLYGINPLSHELYRIDKTGNIQTIATPNVDHSLTYLAGDVTPDGNTFVIIGSNNGLDAKLFLIDLSNGNYDLEEKEFDNGTLTSDISFDPISSKMFGFDNLNRNFYTYNLGASNVNKLSTIDIEHDVDGLYFDTFGNLFGVGTALFGSIAGLFDVDPSNGQTSLISSSGFIPIADLAACPYSLEIDCKITPEVFFPCSEVSFEYTFVNQTGTQLNNINLEHELPSGFSFLTPNNIPNGGELDLTSPENILRIENMEIAEGIGSYAIHAYVDDIPKDIYKSQAQLFNVPEMFGSKVISNNPSTVGTEDSTSMEVNRIDEDSLAFSHLICQGSSLVLDASDYGNNLTWSNGASGQQQEVFETGQLSLIAASGCKELFVSYDIVSAVCPFTIEIGLVAEPDTMYGCSDVLFRYILDNDSGEARYDITLQDTLPLGFTFVEVVNNPYESKLKSDIAPNVFQLENLHLKEGLDTIDILVSTGDSIVGDFKNRAYLKNLPQVLGPLRKSDDPSTFSYPDSTAFFIKGIIGDSLEVDSFICKDESIHLDASLFGESYQWESGSQQNQITIDKAGIYKVSILDGCDEATIIYNVEAADEISVSFDETSYAIHQSESMNLNPTIINQGNLLNLKWNDNMSGTLSCLDCSTPTATPLSNIVYSIKAENEFCVDSAWVEIFVDETRRVFIPNIFSPNEGGLNSRFYLQSPDPASLTSLSIFNRWGNLVFESKQMPLNDQEHGWNGLIDGKLAQSGVYIYQAEIKFFDGKTEIFVGDITLTK